MDNISAKMKALRSKVTELEGAAAQRKAKLDENSAFLQFNWKADVVESWIGERFHQDFHENTPIVVIIIDNVFTCIHITVFKHSVLRRQVTDSFSGNPNTFDILIY